MPRPQSKTLFILGAHGDIGQAVRSKFEQEGYQVIAPSRQELDLSSPESVEAYFKASIPPIDVLVHSAGINYPKRIEEMEWDTLEKTVQVNLLGFTHALRYLIPAIKAGRGRRIVVISSIYGVISRPGRGAYSMSKHGLVGLVQAMALELGPSDILTNAVSPGFVDTRLTRQNNDEKIIRSLVSDIPLGRLANPSDIAEVVYFLGSPQNRYLTGQNIIVDGGYLAGGFQK